MSKIDDGGPAFPGEITFNFSSGMSLRDYFAAEALQGLVSDVFVRDYATDYAESAYLLADAMLAERAKRRDGGS